MTKKRGDLNLYWPWIVCAIYFFTGVTALGYEVLWARMLSTLFGVSIFGVVITVSAFMAGLGAGSVVGGSVLRKISAPLLFFAAVELLVALFAFNLPSLLAFADKQIISLTLDASFSVWFFYQSLSTFFIMLIPAFVLGMGFPLVLGALRETKVPISFIYGINTLGGVVGAFLPLFLLPAVGWIVSDRLIAVFGIVLSVCIVIVHFFARRKTQWQNGIRELSGKVEIKALLAYAGVGASAIMLQVAWTRLFGMVLLRTEYVMAAILATFLIGIGVGSIAGSRFKHKNGFIIFPICISASAIFSLYALPWVSAWAETASYASLFDSMLVQIAIIGLITLPATLLFGAWFPLIVAQFKSEPKMTAYLYGANSIGAALGGLLVGFVILPVLGSTFSIIIAVILLLISSFYWVEQRWFKLLPIIFALAFLPVMSFPSVSELLPGLQSGSKDLSFYEDAISLTQVVEEKSGQRILLSDLQRMDASTDPTAVTVQKNQARLPLLLHPRPKNILFLGLGTGITASGSLPYPNLERSAVELSVGAINAAGTFFSGTNHSVLSKLTVFHDDARRFLKTNSQTYDVIVGDLFHPDMVGRSTLLSLQQFTRGKSRLTTDGLFVQWIALNQFDLKTLKVVLETFRRAFPGAVIFMDGFRLALVGFNGAFYGADAVKKSVALLDVDGKKEITGGEGIWTWLGRYWGQIPVFKVAIQDEWAPVIEYQLPKAKFNRQIDLSQLLGLMIENRPELEIAAVELGVAENDMIYFSRAYQSSQMYAQSWMAYFSGNSDESQKLLSMAYATNPDDQWVGFGLADAMFGSKDEAVKQGFSEQEILAKILSTRPDHLEALRRSLHISQNNGYAKEVLRLQAKMKLIAPLDKELSSTYPKLGR